MNYAKWIRTKIVARKSDWNRWWMVVIYATAMAWVESAVVFYLRTMIDRIEPHQPNPFPAIGGFGFVELRRELATLIMLLAVGMLAGRTWRGRIGYAAIAFGVWDIFYYVFLKIICDWPHTFLDWDILFLLPLPWWGPVLAPILIALLMIAWGTLATQFEQTRASWPSNLAVWGIASIGMAMALLVFMTDTLRAAGEGINAIAHVLPERFHWPWFLIGLILMATPVIRAGLGLRFSREIKTSQLNSLNQLREHSNDRV